MAKKKLEKGEIKEEEVIEGDSESDDEEEEDKDKDKDKEDKPKKKSVRAEAKEPAQKARACGVRLQSTVNCRSADAEGSKEKKAVTVKVDSIIEVSALCFPAACSPLFFDALVEAGFTPNEADRKKTSQPPVAAAADSGDGKEKKANKSCL